MPKKKKASPKKLSSKFPTSFLSYNAEDQVRFIRLSDGSHSVGRIWYFHIKSQRPSVLMIDLLLGNFQLGYVDEINADISKKEL